MKGILTFGLLLLPFAAGAGGPQERILEQVGFEQRIGEPLPDVAFRDAQGETVPLSRLHADAPLVLVPAWYGCPNLCPMLLNNVARAVAALDFVYGDDYRVATVGIAPDEGPETARSVRDRLTPVPGSHAGRWHLLTGEAEAIQALTAAIGFRYAYDDANDRYAHPAGMVVIAPDGRVSKYLFGIDPDAPDLRLALLEAGEGRLGSPIDRLVLRCYRYDPETGGYGLAIMNVLRVAGAGTALALAGLVIVLRRRERGRRDG